MKIKILTLTESARKELTYGLRNGESHCFWIRCRSILLKSEGLSSARVGKQADIVSMILDGSAKSLPEKGFLPRTKQAVSLHILPPVPYDVFKDMPVREIAEYIHHIAAEELARRACVPTFRHSYFSILNCGLTSAIVRNDGEVS